MASMALPWIVLFVQSFVCVVIEARMPNCGAMKDKCQCHPSYTSFKDDFPEPRMYEQRRTCMKTFSEKKSRYLASQTCANEFSSLVYKRLPKSLSEYYRKRGVPLIWIGIRESQGVHIVEANGEVQLDQYYGNRLGFSWDPGSNFFLKNPCVALNISSGNLIHVNCSTELEYACVNLGFPVYPVPKSLACSKGWLLFYQLPLKNLHCIKPFVTRAKDLDATNKTVTCLEIGSEVTDLQDFKNLYNHMNKLNISGYGLKDSASSCETKYIESVFGDTLEENVTCLDKIFICAKRRRRISLKPKVSPDFSDSVESELITKTELTCEVPFKTRDFNEIKDQLHYAWFNDERVTGAPADSRTINVYAYTQPGEGLHYPPNTQGSWRCEVEVEGIADRFSSQTVNYFNSDVMTFIGLIHLDEARKYGNIASFFTNVLRYMQKILADISVDVPWLFRTNTININWIERGRENILGLMKMYFFTTVFDEARLHYEMNKRFKENLILKSSLEVVPAAFCFEQAIPSSSSTYNVTFIWKGAAQTKSAVSDPLCLNDWKLITRKCRPSNVWGARWEQIDVSRCTKYQNSVKELKFKCPAGFKYYDQNFCFAAHSEKKTYGEAEEICKSQSSFLANDNSLYMDWRLITRKCMPSGYLGSSYREFLTSNCLKYRIPVKEKNQYYWQSVRRDLRSQAKVEWVQNNGTLRRMNQTDFCASEKDRNYYHLPLKKCDSNERHPFVCMYQPFLMLSRTIFSKSWYKYSHFRTSYYIEHSKKSWREANEVCNSLPVNSTLLQSIRKLDEYSEFKVLLRQISDEQYDRHQIPKGIRNREFSWWMNLFQDGDFLKWLTSPEESPSYVDWERHTDFNMNQSAGVLTTHFGHYPLPLQWSLRDLSTKQGFICEMQDLEVSHDTAVYVEDRTREKEVEFGDFYELDLHCVPSGWFVWNSISWFKDGAPIITKFSQQRLNLTLKAPFRVEDVSEFQGYYYCSVAVNNSDENVYSSKLLVKIPDIHTFVLHMKSKIPNGDCSDLDSLELPFIDEFNKYLDELYGDGSRLFFKDVNCDASVLNTYHHLYIFKDKGKEKDLLKSLENSISSGKGTLFESMKRLNIHTSVINFKSTVSCSKEISCFNGHCLTWPETPIGESTLPDEMCITEEGSSLERECLGDFITGAHWRSVEKSCVTVHSKLTMILHELAKRNLTGENISNSTQNMEALISTSKDLSPSDVQYVAQFLRNAAAVSSVEPKVLWSYVHTVDAVIDTISTLENNVISTSVPRKISSALGNIAMNVQTNDQTINAAGSNIAVSVLPLTYFPLGAVLEKWGSKLIAFMNDSNKGLNERLNQIENFEAAVLLSENVLTENLKTNRTNMAIIVHKNFQFLKNVKVISPVVHVMGIDPVNDMYHTVELTFKVPEMSPGKKKSWGCVYRDETLKHFGAWSYKGCLTLLIDSTHVRCYCNHLSSFAVIMEEETNKILEKLEPEYHSEMMIIIICCSFLIFVLVIVFLTFKISRRRRRGHA